MHQQYFNISSPNDPTKHYTLLRPTLVKQGMQLVKGERYFTITVRRRPDVIEETVNIEGVFITTYIVDYDEEKDF